jgi:hypothetical protein
MRDYPTIFKVPKSIPEWGLAGFLTRLISARCWVRYLEFAKIAVLQKQQRAISFKLLYVSGRSLCSNGGGQSCLPFAARPTRALRALVSPR